MWSCQKKVYTHQKNMCADSHGNLQGLVQEICYIFAPEVSNIPKSAFLYCMLPQMTLPVAGCHTAPVKYAYSPGIHMNSYSFRSEAPSKQDDHVAQNFIRHDVHAARLGSLNAIAVPTLYCASLIDFASCMPTVRRVVYVVRTADCWINCPLPTPQILNGRTLFSASIHSIRFNYRRFTAPALIDSFRKLTTHTMCTHVRFPSNPSPPHHPD